MRRNGIFIIVLIAITLLTFNCNNGHPWGTCFTTNHVYSPVYLSYSDLRSSVRVDPPQVISQEGKAVAYGNYLFVNEMNTGVHILDFSIPASPQNLGFINIPGNVDLEIKNNTLYAASYVDIVLLDISNPAAPVEVNRVNDLLAYPPTSPLPQQKSAYYAASAETFGIDELIWFEEADPSLGVVTGWTDAGYTFDREYSCGTFSFDDPIPDAIVSQEKFAIVKQNYLYAGNKSSLNLLDITTDNNPSLIGVLPIEYEIYSLISNDSLFFAGFYTNEYIYDIADPLNPVFIAETMTWPGCSPSVADNGFIYMISGSFASSCYFSYSSLTIYDISSPSVPVFASSYEISEPYRLALDNQNFILYVCNGTGGIRLYNTSSSPYLMLIATIPSPAGDSVHDIILSGNMAFVIAESGIYLYDTTLSETGTVTLISSLPLP